MLTLIIILLPVVAALISVPVREEVTVRRIARGVGVVQCLLILLVSLSLLETGVAGSPGDSVSSILAPVDGLHLFSGRIAMWGREWPFAFSIGIDAVSIPFLLLTTFGFAVTIPSLAPSSVGHRKRVILSLLLEASIVATLVAADGVLLTVALGSALLVLGFLIPQQKGLIERSMRRYAPVAFGLILGLGCLMFGLAASSDLNPDQEKRLRVEHTFELRELADPGYHMENREPRSLSDESSWVREHGLVILSLLIPAFFLMLFPFHVWYTSLIDVLPDGIQTIILVSGPLLGLHLLLRCSLFTFPTIAIESVAPTLLCGLGSLTALYTGFVALGERDPDRVVRYILISGSGLATLMVGVGRYDLAFVVYPLVGAATLCMSAVQRRLDLADRGILAPLDKAHWAYVKWLYLTAAGMLAAVPVLAIAAHCSVEWASYATSFTTDPNLPWSGWLWIGVGGGLVVSAGALRTWSRMFRGARSAVSNPSLLSGIPVSVSAASAAFVLLGGVVLGVCIWIGIEYSAPLIERVLIEGQNHPEAIGEFRVSTEGKHG